MVLSLRKWLEITLELSRLSESLEFGQY